MVVGRAGEGEVGDLVSSFERVGGVGVWGKDILVLVVRELFVVCELCLCRLRRHLCMCLMLV